MEHEVQDENKDRGKTLLYISIGIGIISFILLLWNVYSENRFQTSKQHTFSELISTKDIATMSVSEFVYNGLAKSLKANGDIDYYALYKSTVKVSVDANNISYSVDDEQKKVTFYFPKFTIENPVIDIGSITLIPNSDRFMEDVIKLCRSDALEEVTQSEKLIPSAQENLQSITEAWYSPVLEGYSFEFVFDAEVGGETE